MYQSTPTSMRKTNLPLTVTTTTAVQFHFSCIVSKHIFSCIHSWFYSVHCLCIVLFVPVLYSAERGQVLCFGVWRYSNTVALPQVRLCLRLSESPECICIFHSAVSPSCTALLCQHGFSLKCHCFKLCPMKLLRFTSVVVNVSWRFTVAIRCFHNSWYWSELILVLIWRRLSWEFSASFSHFFSLYIWRGDKQLYWIIA